MGGGRVESERSRQRRAPAVCRREVAAPQVLALEILALDVGLAKLLGGSQAKLTSCRLLELVQVGQGRCRREKQREASGGGALHERVERQALAALSSGPQSARGARGAAGRGLEDSRRMHGNRVRAREEQRSPIVRSILRPRELAALVAADSSRAHSKQLHQGSGSGCSSVFARTHFIHNCKPLHLSSSRPSA